MSDQQLATPDQLFGHPSVRRFRGGDGDPGGPIILPVKRARLRIRSLTEGERQRWEGAAVGKKFERLESRVADANRRLFQLCLVNAAGNPFVTDDQRKEMAEWDSADTAYLSDCCAEHCGIGRQALDTMLKNCEGAPAAG